MNTVKQNLALLPEWCYGILPVDKSIIKINAGEIGYYPMKGNEGWLKDGLRLHNVKTTDELADILNTDRNITKAQRKAMEWGSLFGWEHRLSNPKSYTKEGKIIKEKVA